MELDPVLFHFQREVDLKVHIQIQTLYDIQHQINARNLAYHDERWYHLFERDPYLQIQFQFWTN